MVRQPEGGMEGQNDELKRFKGAKKIQTSRAKERSLTVRCAAHLPGREKGWGISQLRRTGQREKKV